MIFRKLRIIRDINFMELVECVKKGSVPWSKPGVAVKWVTRSITYYADGLLSGQSRRFSMLFRHAV